MPAAIKCLDSAAAAAQPPVDRRLCVAPMMDWTDRHARSFLRLISPAALLYTEMVPIGAILYGDRDRFLEFDPEEHPIALQLGGADPGALAEAASEGRRFGYDEINLNVGCPSDRVQNARFGACLMREPALVARCVEAMAKASGLPVTVKTRIGIDHQDDPAFLLDFVDRLAAAGCRTFIIHARKAWLSGLSPKENREIPPLDYGRVHELGRRRPDLEIVINGGIQDPVLARLQLDHVDGVMIGREAYQNPYSLKSFEEAIFGRPALTPPRETVARRYQRHVERHFAKGVPLHAMTRHMLGLFNGLSGARAWRRILSEQARLPQASPDLIAYALSFLPAQSLMAA